MATAALDVLQDVAGGGSRQLSVPAVSTSSAISSLLLPPAKLDFYQAVAMQMKADGLGEEARLIAQRLNVGLSEEGSGVLFSLYEKQRGKLNASSVVEWVSIKPRPLPPIAPQEKLLDLRDFPTHIHAADEEPNDEDMEEHDVIDEIAKNQRAVPPVFKTRYTAQHKQGVRSVAFSSDGRLCASGSTDTSIKIMDTSKMRMFGLVQHSSMEDLRPVVRTFYDHVGTVTALSFHPRQPVLFTGSADKTVKIFDLTKGGVNKKAQASITDVSAVNVVQPHACGDFLLVGTQHPVIRLYDVTTQQCFCSYQQSSHHAGPINDVRSADDGSAFASASADGSVFLWDGINNRVINRLPNAHNGQPVFSAQWSRNNRYLLTTGGDHRARLWDMRTGKQLIVYAAQPGSMSCLLMTASFTHNEEFIVVGSDSDVSLLDARTGSVMVPSLGIPVRSLAASPTDNTFLTGSDDFKVRYVELSEEGEVE